MNSRAKRVYTIDYRALFALVIVRVVVDLIITVRLCTKCVIRTPVLSLMINSFICVCPFAFLRIVFKNSWISPELIQRVRIHTFSRIMRMLKWTHDSFEQKLKKPFISYNCV